MNNSFLKFMNRGVLKLCLLASVALCGCVDSPPSNGESVTRSVQEAQPAEPLRIVNMITRSLDDPPGSWWIGGKIVPSEPDTVVGLAWRLERYTLADGTAQESSDKWHPGDPSELTYAKPALRVTSFATAPFLRGQAHQQYRQVTLRLRAAVADRVETIRIPDFELNREYQAQEHGYDITVSGKEGFSLGVNPATIVNFSWKPPADYLRATDDSDLWIGFRLGFEGKDGQLITPSGSGGGYDFLGRNWAGKTLLIEVPVGIRVVETTLTVDLPEGTDSR